MTDEGLSLRGDAAAAGSLDRCVQHWTAHEAVPTSKRSPFHNHPSIPQRKHWHNSLIELLIIIRWCYHFSIAFNFTLNLWIMFRFFPSKFHFRFLCMWIASFPLQIAFIMLCYAILSIWSGEKWNWIHNHLTERIAALVIYVKSNWPKP